MCKLSAIELSVLIAVFEHSVNSPTATADEKKVLAEMLTLSKELIIKWENSKGQKLWSLSGSKVLTESPDFAKDTNNAKCVIRAIIDGVSEIMVKAAVATLTAPAAPNTPATTAAPAAPVVTATTTTTPVAAEVVATPEVSAIRTRRRPFGSFVGQ